MSTKKRASAQADGEGDVVRRADWRLGGEAPWFAAARDSLKGAEAAGRLPHALLLRGPAGIGKGALAEWIARYALCEHRAAAPCGVCVSCELHAAGNHPDLRRVGLEEGKKQIAVDAVRALIADLGLKSYRGSRRVGIVDPADALNTAGANAFLKTLEEPGAGALLLLVAARTDRLPATIISRCQVVHLAGPDRATALGWLAGQAEADWEGLLSLLHNAPLAALDLARAGADGVAGDMGDLAEALRRGPVDLVAAAEAIHKDFPELRLRWIENWATGLIYATAGAEAPGAAGDRSLPRATGKRHIEALFRLVDETRRAQGYLRGSINSQMLFEGVLAEFAACVRAGGP